MTSCKSSSELVAIYRLEFYKKQKNWKLSASARKEKERKKQAKQATEYSNQLNKTYDIDTQMEDDKTESNPLNIAFCEPEFESETTESLQTNTPQQSLSQQWLEPVNIWPKIAKTSEPNVNLTKASEEDAVECQNNEPKKAWTQKRLEVLLKAAEERDCDAQSESGLEKPPKYDVMERIETNKEPFAWFDEGDENWVPEGIQRTIWSEPWINSANFPQDVWIDRDVIDGLNYRQRAAEILPSGSPSLTESVNLEGERTIDSASEFIRGAHEAPHSSEIDLALPSILRAGDVSSELLSHLTSQQLKQATSEHWRLLTLLLRERQVRQNLRSSMSLYTDISSFEEYPTRDIGPSTPSTTYKDDFISGSHKLFHSVGFGRGRGRIPQNRAGLSFGENM